MAPLLAILAPEIIKSVSGELIDTFIEDKKPNADEVFNSDVFEEDLIQWMNDHVDIPFISESVEEDILRIIVTMVKELVLQRIV